MGLEVLGPWKPLATCSKSVTLFPTTMPFKPQKVYDIELAGCRHVCALFALLVYLQSSIANSETSFPDSRASPRIGVRCSPTVYNAEKRLYVLFSMRFCISAGSAVWHTGVPTVHRCERHRSKTWP